MIQFLAIQVRLGKITIDQVPEKYRDAVITALDAQKHNSTE